MSKWTVKRYARNSIPNTGWMVKSGSNIIARELTKDAAWSLAEAHNQDCERENQQLREALKECAVRLEFADKVTDRKYGSFIQTLSHPLVQAALKP